MTSPTKAAELAEKLAEFNRYFTSANGVDVGERVSVPRDEWRSLHALLRASEGRVPEPMTRFCPGCGSVGEVEAKYRDCCPDGGRARIIPEPLARHCHGLFQLALRAPSSDDEITASPTPPARTKRLATNAAEEFVRGNGIPTGAPDQFVFHGADLADEYFQDCIAHLKWAGECVVFEHDEETTVLLGDYTLGSFE